ncbi:hypothetical protein MLD38_033141 [Melastoma candidum]|uniref:Uncharacterized protein n=1 Tax=Melastoma candidum TaxID=119954 RepID=A0ACB9M7M2_9MYRT|nr:hypothetical protein MLD38_033141 [Melastoma candidum]
MGNSCAGPTLGGKGFFQSLTASVWRARPRDDRLPPVASKKALAQDQAKPESKDIVSVDLEPIKTSNKAQQDQVLSTPPAAVKIPPQEPRPVVREEPDRLEVKEAPSVSEKPPEEMKPNKPAAHRRVSSAGLQVSSVLGRKTENLKDVYSLGRKLGQEEEAPLKTIDFGLSVFFRPGETFTDVVGSPYYVAPEVLRKHYGQECDVWSAGVIIYILLCGVPPFWDETEQGIFEQVLKGDLDFESEPWPSISDEAKDLVRRMLVRDPKKRLTAHEVLCHPWVQVDGVAPDKPLDSAVLSRLKQFSAMNKLKKIAIRVIADSLSEEEIAGLKEMFKMIDADGSGQITMEELRVGLEKVGADLKETDLIDLMQAADIDNSGTIDYGEFIAAMLHLNKIEREDHLYAAFSYFDKDGSGYITQDELQHACEQFGLEGFRVEDIIQEVDQDNDGRIDYSEFVAMMQDTNFGMKGIGGK